MFAAVRRDAVALVAFAASLVLTACASISARGRDPDPTPMTVEWALGPQAAALTAVPEHVWTRDGSAILWDPRRPAAERTLERLDPVNGGRSDLVDPVAACASLRALLGDEAPAVVPWPDGFDDAGRRAVIVLDGDVFVLDVDRSVFRRLTATPEEEKAASVAPDGSRVAFVRQNDLWVADAESGAATRLTDDGSETVLNGTLSWVYWEEIFGRRDIGYWWSPDSARIAFLRSDQSDVAVAHFVDFEPQVPRVLTQRYPKAGTANPKVTVGVVAADGGDVTWMSLGEPEYVCRVQWLPNAGRLAVQTMSRDQRRLDLLLCDAEGGAPKHVLTETDPGWVNVRDDLHFLRGGERFLWVSERDGYAHLYLYALDGELVRQLTSGPWSLCSAGGGVFWLRQALVAVDEARGQVWFTALEKSSVERQLYRVRLDGGGFERISIEDGTHQISFAPNAGAYLDTFSDLATPPAMRLHAPDGALRAVVAPARTDLLDGVAVRTPELLSIPTEDGTLELPAALLRPDPLEPGRRYPVILHVYAGPSAPMVQNVWQNGDLFDQVLLDAGYGVFEVDNRSATGISKTLENDILGQMSGDSELHDLVHAVDWLRGQEWVDPDRIGVWGWSGGGTTTLLLMTRSDRFAAGIAVAPVTDWRYYDTKWAEAVMKRPADNPEGYEHTSLVRRAGDLHGRLLLVHGTDDDNVHPQNTWAFADAAIAAGVPFDMMIYPMRKHGIADPAARLHLFHKMVEFWRLWL